MLCRSASVLKNLNLSVKQNLLSLWFCSIVNDIFLSFIIGVAYDINFKLCFFRGIKNVDDSECQGLNRYISTFLFCFWVISVSAQASLLTVLRRANGMVSFKAGLAACKASNFILEILNHNFSPDLFKHFHL